MQPNKIWCCSKVIPIHSFPSLTWDVTTEHKHAFWLIARTTNAAVNISYRVLDVLCTDAAEALYEEIGDANLYVRAVLHQLSATDLSSAAEPYFAQLITQYGAASPSGSSVRTSDNVRHVE
jgi:hypothetical protein